MGLFDALREPKKGKKPQVICKECGHFLNVERVDGNLIFTNKCHWCWGTACDEGYYEAKKEIEDREEEVEEGERVLKKLGLYYKELIEEKEKKE